MLAGKAILAVDDEPDVLETIIDVLHMCRIETAGNFAKAEEFLAGRSYDLVILDVMGVRGLHLLERAVAKGIPAVMITAPALSPEFIFESMEKGAISYIPKEDLIHLDSLLTELFSIMSEGKSPWIRTLDRLEPVLAQRLTPEWRERFRTFLESGNHRPGKSGS